jgi:hypothetical protein
MCEIAFIEVAVVEGRLFEPEIVDEVLATTI